VPIQLRLDKFREKAIPLVSDVCRRAITDAGIAMDDIGKLIVVSSTGFIGPGLDCHLIQEIGLSRGVDRTLIGFMGCAAVRAKPTNLASGGGHSSNKVQCKGHNTILHALGF